jgi:hypothetical protein
MNTRFPSNDSEHCPSQLVLDRLFAEELGDLDRVRVSRHVAACTSCARELANRLDERDAFAPDPQLLARLRKGVPGQGFGATPKRWRWFALVSAPLAVCAAGLLLMLRPTVSQPEDLIDRSATRKGGGSVALFVQRDGELRELGDAAQVNPGDQLQATIRTPARRFVAVYSRDGEGTISRYSPVDLPMVQVEPGGDVILPNSTVLDAVLGGEVLAVFLCQDPRDDLSLRARVESGQLAGCEVVRYHLQKVPR